MHKKNSKRCKGVNTGTRWGSGGKADGGGESALELGKRVDTNQIRALNKGGIPHSKSIFYLQNLCCGYSKQSFQKDVPLSTKG